MELKKKMIRLNQHFSTKEEAITAAGQLLVEDHCVQPEYVQSMIDRNNELSTYMGNFIAIPHGTDAGKQYIHKTGISVMQIPEGVEFGSAKDSKLVTIVFGIAGLNNEHLDVLSQIALFCSKLGNVAQLSDAQSEQEIINLLKEVGE
ncbi:PTS sugar transporter subunit IIA [Bombilactobacillus folatiphilus]|uniref:Mannitol-specific phosphotransferase enzyme IIA component n=1 Tax=Bombilactobacillus folatiphilus TaxID=2923362 RepID=A0ABY4P780_9LACO|nr:PTS sugar transporter subunit IIA [Bombilactobacillus folatiphilus]UQS81445.1 PTS sugar transporter subunit IIA [Bombilactobacillus folatiphilus]